MRDWGWPEYVLVGVITVFLTLCGIAIVSYVQEDGKAAECVGKTYSEVVQTYGTPTEEYRDNEGTIVVCWKQYHAAYMQPVNAGKVTTFVYHPAYISGWKAVIKSGKCVSMERL